MSQDLLDYWNTDHSKRTIDKGASEYAVKKEQFFPAKSHILDLGGGRGADAVYFIKKGHTVVLADISDTALFMAKERAVRDGEKLNTVQVILGKDTLPFGVDTFDIVYSRLALHYFSPEETTTIFKDIYRILKPKGFAFLTLKSPSDQDEMNYLRSNAKQIVDNVFEENGVIKSRYTSDQLKDILNKANINTYEVKEIDESLFKNIEGAKSGNTNFILNEITLTKN